MGEFTKPKMKIEEKREIGKFTKAKWRNEDGSCRTTKKLPVQP